MPGRRFTSRWARGAVAATAAAVMLAAGGVAVAAARDTDDADPKKPSVKVMTYNVCANSKPKDPGTDHTRCAKKRQTAEVAEGIMRKMVKREDLRVVMLQEICSVDIDRLNKLHGLKEWEFFFSAIRDRGEAKKPTEKLRDRRCNPDIKTGEGRGKMGVGIGVKTHDVSFRAEDFTDEHSPDGRDRWGHWDVRQTVACADVKKWDFTACGTHLTPPDDGSPDKPNQFWRAQKAQVLDLRKFTNRDGAEHVVFGGDLNQAAPDGDSGYGDKSTVAPLYESHIECEQSSPNSKRDGRGTFQWANGGIGHKIDYLFANRNAETSCYVPETHVSFADHLPVVGTFTF